MRLLKHQKIGKRNLSVGIIQYYISYKRICCCVKMMTRFDKSRRFSRTCVRRQVRAGSRTVDASCVILECGRLLVVLHDGFQVAGALLVAEVKGQGQTETKARKKKREESMLHSLFFLTSMQFLSILSNCVYTVMTFSSEPCWKYLKTKKNKSKKIYN